MFCQETLNEFLGIVGLRVHLDKVPVLLYEENAFGHLVLSN